MYMYIYIVCGRAMNAVYTTGSSNQRSSPFCDFFCVLVGLCVAAGMSQSIQI